MGSGHVCMYVYTALFLITVTRVSVHFWHRGEWGELYRVKVVSGRFVPNLSMARRSRYDQLMRQAVRHLSLYFRLVEWARLAVRTVLLFFEVILNFLS